MSITVKTRFAPSPTGFLHLGGARTALYAWAYARHHGGTFVLRIEDTDLERSTPEAVQAILDGMKWLGLEHDEGPYYQTQRMDRYRDVINAMLDSGAAYRCYCSPAELDAMRDRLSMTGEKPRYDGTWRPEPGKTLPPVPAGVNPVVRFRNPVDGEVSWVDAVKGLITIANRELDDVVIARADGTPTYNFCVAVDDSDMEITHVLRGDDHVNNTPRQINILRALRCHVPIYGHLPMIHGFDGRKLSKRHGAASVMDYAAKGILPEAMINYLSRLGWSHGDDEIFSSADLCRWFDLHNLTPSPAMLDADKLMWVNGQHMKGADPARLAVLLGPIMEANGIDLTAGPGLEDVVRVLRDRANSLNVLASECALFYTQPVIDKSAFADACEGGVRAAIDDFVCGCRSVIWDRASISMAIKTAIGAHGLKMPQLAMPLRLALTGSTNAPAIDAVLEVFGRERALERIQKALAE